MVPVPKANVGWVARIMLNRALARRSMHVHGDDAGLLSTEQSADAEASWLPSAEKDSAHTGSVCARSFRSSRPSDNDHSRVTWSSPPDASVAPL